ncbi:MAG: RodZ domain-containing protein [Phormidesmis sp.]
MTKFSAPQQNQLAQIGAFLRDHRAKQEKSLEDIAMRTYIRPQLLNGIETGDPDLLPEPIFVQGFIRRYAEALGLNGTELAQQFTVSSIPSTPRPSRQPEPINSSTTRLSRAGDAPPPTSRTPAETPIFRPESVSPPAAEPTAVTPPTAEPAAAEIENHTVIAEATPEPTLPVIAEDSGPQEEAQINQGDHEQSESGFAQGLNGDTATAIDDTDLELASPFNPPLDETTLTPLDSRASADTISQSDVRAAETQPPEESVASPEVSFESKVAAFDQANLAQSNQETPDLAPPVESVSSSEISPETQAASSVSEESADSTPELDISSTQENDLDSHSLDHSLDDSLGEDGLSATPPPAMPIAAAPVSHSTLPVGVELPASTEHQATDTHNLKPFVIGGLLAALLTAGMVVFAGMLRGGGDRQPEIATSPNAAEQSADAPNAEASSSDPVGSIEPAPATPPPASTAPVYVEATATGEAWVSIIADGNPIFEGTLNAGDTQLWEAQKNISVYSGNAGALELAANGEEAEVMGAPGQPQEKIFP